MVVTCEQMQRLEEDAFARGVTAEALMDEAGRGIADAVVQFFPRPGVLVLVLGKGNNAGDALVAAKWLGRRGWKMVARLVYEVADFKPLPLKHWEILQGGEMELRRVDDLAELSQEPGSVVVLDGLLGIGVKGVIRPEMARVIAEVNEFRRRRHAVVVAMDLPSGLESEGGENCVRADITLAIGRMKRPLIEDRAVNLVGRLALVPLRELDLCLGEGGNDRVVLSPGVLLDRLVCRDFDFHKGQAGRVGIVAGSRGTLGAAVLSASGALLAGAGLVTVYVLEEIYPLVVGMMPVEVMVKPVEDGRAALRDRLDVLVIGPGMGSDRDAEMLELIRESKAPMVVDADGLNALARAGVGEVLAKVKAPVLLTPHPGEMSRLAAGDEVWEGMKGDRGVLARAFVERFEGENVTLLLKGSRTVIAHSRKPLAFNSTGHPGMASGGMGDVLSGVCGALIALGVEGYDAACIGAWVCGRAAELVIEGGEGAAESLTASQVAGRLGVAFGSLRRLDF